MRSPCSATRPPTCSPRRCAGSTRASRSRSGRRSRTASTTTSTSRRRSTTPTSRRSRPRCSASSPRVARGSARRSPPTRRGRGSTAEGEPYKVELVDTAEGAISLYTQGDFTDLCRGPHLQTSAPIKAFKLTSLAGAYWRGDSTNTQLTRIYGTAFFTPEGSRRAPRAARGGARARPPPARHAARPVPLRRALARARRSGIPKGMAIFNALEDLRRRENARRGYSEVKTPLIYDKALWVTSGHWEKFRENMFLIPVDDEHMYAIKPMNCPGHMLLFGSQLRSYRDLPLRYAEAAPLHRNELAGRAARAHARALRDAGRRAHLLHARSRSTAELDGCLDYLRYLYGLFGIEPRAELSTRPDNKLGDRRRVGLHRGQARRGARAARDRRTSSARARARSTGRRSTSTSPTRSAARGSSARSSSTRRCRPASASPTWAPTTASTPSSSSTGRSSARSSASSAS